MKRCISHRRRSIKFHHFGMFFSSRSTVLTIRTTLTLPQPPEQKIQIILIIFVCCGEVLISVVMMEALCWCGRQLESGDEECLRKTLLLPSETKENIEIGNFDRLLESSRLFHRKSP